MACSSAETERMLVELHSIVGSQQQVTIVILVPYLEIYGGKESAVVSHFGIIRKYTCSIQNLE